MATPAIAVVLTGAAVVACYEPRLRDCTLRCSAVSDCAGDQLCAGGWCAAPGTSCASEDAGGDTGDGRTIDARDIDAPVAAVLRIEVKGLGRVDTDQAGVTCAGPDGDCRFDLVAGMVVVLTPIDGDDAFHRWRNDCEGQSMTCTLTLEPSTHAKAEFE